jgi:hypothetical protein
MSTATSWKTLEANGAVVGAGAPALGRPTCLGLPASLQHGTITVLGCIENRVYTGRSRFRWSAAHPPHSPDRGAAELCRGTAGTAFDGVRV